jgi:hypothetical protein
VPARFFCSIKTFLSRLNKTLLITIVAVLLATMAFVYVFAADKTINDLNLTYQDYLSNFGTSPDGKVVSGISSNGLKDTSGGIVFTINLGFTSTPTNTQEDHWKRIDGHPNDFIIKLCPQNDPVNCFLNSVDLTRTNLDGHEIYYEDDQGNYIDTEPGVTVSAFDTAGNINQTNRGSVYSWNAGTDTTATLSNGVTLSPGATYNASFWYCATDIGAGAVADYKANHITTQDAVTDFGSDICGGSSFFRIGQPTTFTMAADATAAQQQVAAGNQALTQPGTSGSSSQDDNLPKCSVLPYGDGSINGCAAQITWYIYVGVAWIASIFGKLFDFFIGYSVSDQSYRYAFAVTGWKLVRDISNIFFIIIMVYTGFSAVFDTTKNSMKSVVPNLIINALLINFSLFATRVVIDISNITARMFYSRMLVCDQQVIAANNGTCPAAQAKRGLGNFWPLSEKILSAFNPQEIFSKNILHPPSYADSTASSGTVINTLSQGTSTNLASRDYANYFGVVCLVAIFIMVMVGIMFFKVSFLFIGRVVGLYICMIFSPFAFLSRDMPMLGGIERLRWNDWKKELVSYAMLAPIFIFMLYIIFVLLSSSLAAQIGIQDSSGSFFGTVLSIVIPMLIIFFLIQTAQKMAEKYAGEIGKAVQTIGSTTAGLLAGVATGTTALVGSRVVGGLAKRVDESRVGVGIRNMAAKNGITGITGRALQRGLNNTRSSSFDVRQTGLGKEFFSRLGVNADSKALNALSGVGLGLGTDQRKGGLEADIKRRQEKELANEKLLEEKDAAGITAYNERQKKLYDKKVTDAVEAEMTKTYGEANVAVWKNDTDKKNYNKFRDEVLKKTTTQAAVNAIAPAKQVATAEELTSTRRKTYTEGLKEGGYFNQAMTKLAGMGEGGAQLSELLGATVGAVIGSDVRNTGNKKAAKKIEEKTKTEKELSTIEETLKNGFRDLIATERFQTTPKFVALKKEEQQEIVSTGSIQNGPNKGKRMYDMLTPEEQSAVDAEQKVINADKDTREKWEKRVQAVEQSRYNKNQLQKDNVALRKAMLNATNATESAAATAAWLAKLDEIDIAAKHNKIWSDIGKYREEQKKKLKDEESK